MSASSVPPMTGIDHVHVNVRDRAAALAWYQSVLGCEPVAAFECWATPTGPLVIENAAGNLHLALFERDPAEPASIAALGTNGEGFLKWLEHLDAQGLEVRVADHELALSVYFEDPDGNSYEVTTYERNAILDRVAFTESP